MTDLNLYDPIAKGNNNLIKIIQDEPEINKQISLLDFNPNIDININTDLFTKNVLNNNLITLIFKRFIFYKQRLLIVNNKTYDDYLSFAITEYISNNSNQNVYRLLSNYGKSSALLNSALFEFFYTNLPLDNIFKTDISKIIDRFLNITTTNILTVFHGTNSILHNNSYTFTTYGFLSTTIDMTIANSYGKNIYVIKLPQNFPYLNINDKINKQYLLPISTIVTIDNALTISQNNNNIFVGIASFTPNNLQIIKTVISESKFTEETINALEICQENCRSSPPKKFCSIKKGASKLLYYKDYLLKFNNNLRRVFNEKLASSIYNYLGVPALDYTVFNFEDKYCIGSQLQAIDYNLNQERASNYLKNFMWDCILANWDVGMTRNVGFNGDNIAIRTDVGGALAYRSRGEFKLDFFNNSTPIEHLFLLEQPFIKDCIKLNPNYKTIINSDLTNLTIDKFDWINQFPESYKNFGELIIERIKVRYNYYKNYQFGGVSQNTNYIKIIKSKKISK
jgi:hypothetical protein